MSAGLLEAVKALPVSERIELISEIWGTIESDDIPVTPEEIKFAEERLREHEQDPSGSVTLEELKAQYRI